MVLLTSVIFFYCLYKSYEDYPTIWNMLLVIALLMFLISTGLSQFHSQ